MEKMTQEGYTANFGVQDQHLQHMDSGHAYAPDQVHIVDFYRFEGITDPDDSSILYVIETNDGRKGMLVDAYGVYSNPDVDEFIKGVDDIKKKKGVEK
jgi:hypothetical protein